MVGLTAGAVQGSLSNYLAGRKKDRISVTMHQSARMHLAMQACWRSGFHTVLFQMVHLEECHRLGLGLLGLKQGAADSTNGEAPPVKARRKRIVRKKVTTTSA
ncbi:hypothetical protein MLD38_026667 [Melastoma candidum]|uniref:Uncharacterized protein n=1 Tax=Melastoma candidum TaxID=119954 RepID=A0ACB9P0N4_9MYRT|nr:hypothetical protein MLD38_026667 [Melastoma candidum]